MFSKEVIKEELKEKLKESNPKTINSNSIFDKNGNEYPTEYEDLLHFRDVEGYKKKGVYALIESMTGEEYFTKCWELLRDTRDLTDSFEEFKKKRRDELIDSNDYGKNSPIGENKIEYLKQCILKGEKFELPYIDYTSKILPYPNQEGLHRIMAASELVGWDKKFPILVVYPYKFLDNKELTDFIRNLIIEKLDRNKIYTENDFIDNIYDLIESNNIDININDVKLSSSSNYTKTRQLTVYISYLGDEYQLPFSLRNPENLLQPLFNIVDNNLN